jgi:hypothetical protein
VDVPEEMQGRLPQLRFRHLHPLALLFATQQPGAEQLLARKNWLSRFHGQISFGHSVGGNRGDNGHISTGDNGHISTGDNGHINADGNGYINGGVNGGDLELLSLSPRNAYSDELVLRVRNTRPRNGYMSSNDAVLAVGGGRADQKSVIQLDMAKLFRSDFIVTNVQIRSLALSESAAVLSSSRIGSSFLPMDDNRNGGGGGDRYSDNGMCTYVYECIFAGESYYIM